MWKNVRQRRVQKKNKKMQSVDLGKSNESLFEKNPDWKNVICKNEANLYTKNLADKNDKWLIPRFSDMRRSARLIFERLSMIRIRNILKKNEKKLLIEMLYRKKVCLFWKFSEIKKVKSKIISSLKIKTIFHKT